MNRRCAIVGIDLRFSALSSVRLVATGQVALLNQLKRTSYPLGKHINLSFSSR